MTGPATIEQLTAELAHTRADLNAIDDLTRQMNTRAEQASQTALTVANRSIGNGHGSDTATANAVNAYAARRTLAPTYLATARFNLEEAIRHLEAALRGIS